MASTALFAENSLLQYLNMNKSYSATVDKFLLGQDEVEHDRVAREFRDVARTVASLQLLEGHTKVVGAVVFSPDGKQLASPSVDGTVRLWDTATGATLHTLEGHNSPVLSIAYTPDGKELASISRDQMLRIWDTATGAAIQTLDEIQKTLFLDEMVDEISFKIYPGSPWPCLRTNIGQFYVSVSQGVPCQPAPATDLSVEGQWIGRGGNNLLQLPREYLSGTAAVYGNTVAVGSRSGQVLMLEFRI